MADKQKKKILSISLGASNRDHKVEFELLGYDIELCRIGTDGDFKKAIELYSKYDGKVDAFGVGGVLEYIEVSDKKYYVKDARKIYDCVRVSKIADGNGIKNILEANAVSALRDNGFNLNKMKTLALAAIDRYGLAKSLVENGCDVTFGDIPFLLNIPIPLKSLHTIENLGKIILPILTKLPVRWFYPQGKDQDEKVNLKYSHYFENCELIASDYLLFKKHMPNDLSGKILITNTTTKSDVEELKKRKLKLLVTSTPVYNGRSFGTNVIEAMLLSIIDKPQSEITENDFIELINSIPLTPNLNYLN